MQEQCESRREEGRDVPGEGQETTPKVGAR